MLAISEFLTLLIWFFVAGVTEASDLQPEVHAILIYVFAILFCSGRRQRFLDNWLDDSASFEMKPMMDFDQL